MLRAFVALPALVAVSIFCSLVVLIPGLFVRSHRLYAWSSRVFGRTMLAACGVRVRVQGREHTAGLSHAFFVGNHQSALDIPLLMFALGGNVRFTAKRSLFWIPLFGWTLSMYGCIPIDRKRPRSVQVEVRRLLRGLRTKPVSFVQFPEGTRTRDGSLQPFKRGALKIAQRSGLPIVPFSIVGAYEIQNRGIRIRPGTIQLVIGEVIPADAVSGSGIQDLHDRVRSAVEAGMLRAKQGRESISSNHSARMGACLR